MNVVNYHVWTRICVTFYEKIEEASAGDCIYFSILSYTPTRSDTWRKMLKNDFYATMRNLGVEPFNEYEYMTNHKRETDEATQVAFEVLCEAEAERDILASYAHLSDEAYEAWVEVEAVVAEANVVYDKWKKEQETVDDEYYRFIEELDCEIESHMYRDYD